MSTSINRALAEVAWVRALALGFGYSAQPDHVCLQELLAAARGSVTTLQQAREILHKLADTDATAGQQTGRLLKVALNMALEYPGDT